jgi:hypothetical protein
MHQRMPTIRRLILAAATAILAFGFAVRVTVAAGPAASGASTTATRALATATAKPKPTTTVPTTPTAARCADGSAPVLFAGQSYCTGYVIGVKRGTYGIGKRVVLRSVTVVGRTGATVTVEGGPSCLPPATICGATIPSVTASFAGQSMVPAYGDVIDLFGITGSSSMSATGYIFRSHCNPDFGC